MHILLALLNVLLGVGGNKKRGFSKVKKKKSSYLRDASNLDFFLNETSLEITASTSTNMMVRIRCCMAVLRSKMEEGGRRKARSVLLHLLLLFFSRTASFNG